MLRQSLWTSGGGRGDGSVQVVGKSTCAHSPIYTNSGVVHPSFMQMENACLRMAAAHVGGDAHTHPSCLTSCPDFCLVTLSISGNPIHMKNLRFSVFTTYTHVHTVSLARI